MSAPNGHRAVTNGQVAPDAPPELAPAAVAGSAHVADLEQELADAQRELELKRDLSVLYRDPVFRDALRSEMEADREVDQKVRAMERKDRLRAGKTKVRTARRDRRHESLSNRAEAARERILDPARALGADYRRWVVSASLLGLLALCSILIMAVTVHDGVLGEDGSWTGYIIEPLASVLLTISMGAQFTARMRGVDVPIKYVFYDVALAVASLVLNLVPHGVRYGWHPETTVVHLLTPLLLVMTVIGWHLAAGLYAQAIATSKHDAATQHNLALLRAAVKSGELDVNPSANAVTNHLRSKLPKGISWRDGRRIGRMFLGY